MGSAPVGVPAHSLLRTSLHHVSDVPAGWFPDPSGVPGQLRYWDGTGWTEHVHRQAPPPYGQTYGQTYGRASADVSGRAPGHDSGHDAGQVGPTTPDGEPLAGWWHRVGASSIDSIFGAILTLAVTIPAQLSIQRETDRLTSELERRLDADDPHALSWFFDHLVDVYRDRLWIFLVPTLLLIIGQAAFLHYRGGTPGQLVTGLRTRLRDRPGPLSWSRALSRGAIYLGAPILLELIGLASGSWTLLVVLGLLVLLWQVLNPLWAAWDGKRQALHDKLVGTNVVRARR